MSLLELFSLKLRGLFLVGLLVEVEEQTEEYGRVKQQQGGHQFGITAVEDENLSGVEEHEGELKLK